jgi:hypothetical protein
MKEVAGLSGKFRKKATMYSAHAKHRVTTALAGLLIAGSGLLAATSASAADPQPGTRPATTAAPAPAKGTTSANGTTGPTAGVPATAPAQVAGEPKGRVVSRLPLSIRARATTQSGYLGSFPSGAVIYLHCKVTGQNVAGNNRWYLLGNGHPGYVAARYVQNLSTVPWCKS